jgi:hypothetical protein
VARSTPSAGAAGPSSTATARTSSPPPPSSPPSAPRGSSRRSSSATPLAFALVTGTDPNAAYDGVIRYVGVPLVVLTTVGIARAVVLQAVFRAALYHHLLAETAPDHERTDPVDALATVRSTIDDAYGAGTNEDGKKEPRTTDDPAGSSVDD